MIYELAEMVNIRSFLGWTTHGHSGVDVNLYAKGRKSYLLRTSQENTDVGKFVADVLDLDMNQTPIIPRNL